MHRASVERYAYRFNMRYNRSLTRLSDPPPTEAVWWGNPAVLVEWWLGDRMEGDRLPAIHARDSFTSRGR